MDVVTVEINDHRCGRLQFELPADAPDEEIAYMESLVPRLESGWLQLRDPDTDEVVISCRLWLMGESRWQQARSSIVKVLH
jgi:hypothetical protein